MTNKFSCFLTQKGRWLTATLFLLFTMGIGQMRATDVTLFSANFSDASWSSATFSQGNTTTPDVINGITFYAKNSDGAKNFSISDGKLIWPNNNIASSNYFLGIPVSNVNGTITVTVQMTGVSGKKANVKYVISDGETSVSTPGGTGTQATAASNGTGTITITSGTLSNVNKKAVVYLGRYNGNTENTNVESITITTPAPSCTKPGTPATLAASDITQNSATLTWDPLGATTHSDGYKVSIVKKSDASVIVDWTENTTTSYSATGLTKGTTYTFKVKAIGETGYCEEGDVATLDFTTTAPTHGITYTNTKGAANSNPATYTEGVGIASFAKLPHAEGYDFTGWSPSSISNTATTDQTIEAQWIANAVAEGTGTLTYALAFGSGTVTTSSITRDNGALYDATDVSVASTSFDDGAAKNGCSGKLHTTSAKENSNYVELTFKVADGYTFTPTEVRVRGNAVSTAKTLEVELKDNATTPNGKSVSGALADGSTDGGVVVTLDFDATGEVALEGTVTAKIFVYGATNAWRLGTSIVITGTVAAVAPASGWSLHGSFDTWGDGYAMSEAGTNIVRVERTLNANTHYEFKIVNGTDWYGNGETFGGTKTQEVSAIGTSNDCHLVTSEQGTYRFDYNTESHNLTITYPNTYTFYYSNTDSWEHVYVYKFSYNEVTGENAAWPGVEITTPTALCGDYYAAASDGYAKLIFNNGLSGDDEKKTGDMVVASDDEGKYVAGTGSAWTAMSTYTISFAGNGNTSGEMSDIASICPTTDQALTANAFAKTGYNFAGWVADVDVTVGDETITAGNLIANEATLKNITSNIALTAQWAIDCPASGTLFSASVAATSKQSIPASTSDLALTASQATVTGGTMSVYNAQTKEKDLIADNSSTYYFTETNNDTYFKIKLDCALEEGDIIQIDAVGGTRVKEEVTYELGLWVSTATSRPGSAPACAGTSSESTLVSKMINYQVQDGDEYEGKSTLYIYRAYGATQYFGDITITRPEKFTVTYWKNDETTDKTVDDNAAVVADNEFTRSGYRFIEWNTQADGNGSKVNVGAAVTADIELFAIWAQEYTVSYANTGAAEGAAPTNENKYIAGETFKVAGVGSMVAAADHAFGGWNDGSTTYQENDDYTVGTDNVSFVPVWNETFNVYYYPNGGGGTAYTAPNVTTVNECFFAPAAGKLFDKWTTHEDGTGDVYAPGAAVTTSINLYAQWKDDECTARQSLIAVTFTGETGATAVVNGYNEKEYASAALIDKLGDNNGPTDGGYKIYGDGGYIFATIAKGDFQEGDKLEVEVTQVPASQKLDVYAYGDDIATAYKVVSIEQVSAAETYSYALTAANATAINALGYKSLGIYRATGSNMNAYVKSLSIKGCRSWVIKHDVTFDLNGQTGSAPAAQSIAEGGLVTKPADPEVAGQFFRGWFTDDECTAGNEWDFANDVVGNTDMTLYAKWEADPCTNRRSIVKAVMASTTTATVTGYNENEYAGGYLLNGLGTGDNCNTYDFGEGTVTGYKLTGNKSAIMATLAKGGFAEGDKVIIAVTKAADGGKLPIYVAKDKDNAVSIVDLDVTDAGIYTYTLTAANIATIEAAGEGYMSIGAYRGTYNPFIYSVELTGCRNWSVYHTLTFAKEDDTEIAAEQLAEGVYASTVAPKAPRVSGYHFLGWSTTKNDADAIVNLAEYTITTDKTLYAVYAANDCSGNGVMFSMTPVANELADDYAPKGDVERDYSDYATISGGEVYINNVAATDTRIKVFKTSSNIQLCGGEDAYIHVLLDCPLHEDDTIKIENDQAWKISLTKNDGYVNKAKADKYHIVPAAWADKDEFYIRRGGSNLTVSGLKVIRPAKYTVSFDMKGHGIAPADIENVLEGSKISAPDPAPTDASYSFAGWYKETTLENAWDFANDVVNANTTLYAKWLDKSDATLKSLKYGETEIIEVGTYTYNIDLPSKTASVPALTAETNNPNAAKLITNAETFNVDGEATSTVVVTPEAGTPVTYTVNFSKLPDMPLLDVTASTTWNFANAAAYNSTFTDEVLANFPGMPDASVFDAQRLQASGSKIQSDNLQGTPVKFHTTTPGKVRVEFSNTGSSSPRPYRYLVVNGVRTEYKSNGTAHVTSAWITVPAGDVILEGECVENGDGTCTSDNLNFYKIEFNATPDLTRPATPGRYGTICYPTAGYFVGGTLYEIAYYDATAEKIFLDEIINGEMIADRPYVFLPNDGVTEVGMVYSEDERAEVTAGKFNGLHGTYVALNSSNTTESPLWNNYLISNNQYICVTGSNCTLSKNRAYIVMSEMTTTPTEPRHGRRRVAIGAAPKTATDIENIVGGETPVKLMINGQMYILRGEKLYDATGRLVK